VKPGRHIRSFKSIVKGKKFSGFYMFVEFVREEKIIGKFVSKEKMNKHQFFGASFSPINEFYWTSGFVV
jgi:hypothetical protein